MSEVVNYSVVSNWDELKQRAEEAAQGCFFVEDFGIGHYEAWGARGFDRRMGITYDGPDSFRAIILNPEDYGSTSDSWRTKFRHDEYEMELRFSVVDQQDAPDNTSMVTVRVDVVSST